MTRGHLLTKVNTSAKPRNSPRPLHTRTTQISQGSKPQKNLHSLLKTKKAAKLYKVRSRVPAEVTRAAQKLQFPNFQRSHLTAENTTAETYNTRRPPHLRLARTPQELHPQENRGLPKRRLMKCLRKHWYDPIVGNLFHS
jgi:hypothetical protein